MVGGVRGSGPEPELATGVGHGVKQFLAAVPRGVAARGRGELLDRVCGRDGMFELAVVAVDGRLHSGGGAVGLTVTVCHQGVDAEGDVGHVVQEAGGRFDVLRDAAVFGAHTGAQGRRRFPLGFALRRLRLQVV